MRRRGTRKRGRTSVQSAGSALHALFTDAPSLPIIERWLKGPCATMLSLILSPYPRPATATRALVHNEGDD